VNDLSSAALAYAHRGWRMFPLHGIVKGVCSCGRLDCSSPGKHPLVRQGLYEATTDEVVIRRWWTQWSRANIGVATGEGSGIAVVDIDLPAAFGALECLMHGSQTLPLTLTALTGGGGVHLIYRSHDGQLGNSAGRLPGIRDDLSGVDLRANGGYIVAPPSVHHTGNRYEWLDEDREPVPVPTWLRRPARTYVELQAQHPPGFDGEGTAFGLAVLRHELDRVRAAQVRHAK
jgi:putative DNA primase/helicase